MIAKKIKILIKSDGSYLDTILPPITANEDGRTIVQVIAPFPITDIVSVNYSIRPIQATVKGSYLVPTGKFGKDVLADDYTHFQTVADWNVFEIPINAVALEYISKYRAGLVLVSFAITQLQTPYFATNYLGLFSNTQPIPATSYNDGDYFIANEYNFTAHDIAWAKGDYAYFYNGKWNKGKSVLKASTPSIELPVDPSLKDAPQLEYDEDVALLLANDLGLLTQRVSQAETDIESAENDINEIDGRVGVNETDIYNLESDVGNLQSDKADKTDLAAAETMLDGLVDGTQDIAFDNTISGLTATTVKGAIDEISDLVKNIGLDAHVAELNNHTLREVFEENIFQENLTGTVVSQGNLFNKDYSPNDLNYIRININYTGTLGTIYYTSIYSPTLNNRTIDITTNIINKGYYSIIQNDLDYTRFNLYLTNSDLTINLMSHYRVPLIELGIDNLTVEQMDYWFSEYQRIKNEKYYTEEETNTLLNAKLNTSLKGAVNGLAELGSDGKVPSGQLPSYVDDVLEYANLTAFPANGESGKIYVALDTNKTYRWSGSGYIEISASLAIGETSSTAGRGDWTKTAHDHTFLTNNPHGVTKAQLGLSNVDNTSDLDKPVSTAQQTSLNTKVDKIEGKGLSTEDYTTIEKNKLAELTVGITVEAWGTATKTLALSDANKLFLCASTSDQTLTIPTHDSVPFPIGTVITFLLISIDKVTFSSQTGVDIMSMDSLVELATPHGMASLIKVFENIWQLVGALE